MTLHPPLRLFLLLTSAMMYCPSLIAKTLLVGPGKHFLTASHAAPQAGPGDTVLLHTGSYAGEESFRGLQGQVNAFIHVLAAPNASVVIMGGSFGWHLSNVAYLHISGIRFEGQSGNGLNIDDGGIFTTPSHHVNIDSCYFSDIQVRGNYDLLKLSGVDSFVVTHCYFKNGADNGSGIDLVGCHNGAIQHCSFTKLPGNGVQAKGGSSRLVIDHNLFTNCGQRSLNLGGHTGKAFFRPQNAGFEAAHLFVYANIIIGSQAGIAFVGCINSHVFNNTLYQPARWAVRILQENPDSIGLARCSRNHFYNNLVYFGMAEASEVNIGAATLPATFTFANNCWYNAATRRSGTIGRKPYNETATLRNVVPGLLWKDGVLSIAGNSVLAGKGRAIEDGLLDFDGHRFKDPPVIGAQEVGAPHHP